MDDITIVYIVKNIRNNQVVELFDSADKAQSYIDEHDEFGELSFYGKVVK